MGVNRAKKRAGSSRIGNVRPIPKGIPHSKCPFPYCISKTDFKCFECKKRFCALHIWSGQVKKSMKEDEAVRNICDKCKEEKKYFDMDDPNIS
jgi:hypothetical protein